MCCEAVVNRLYSCTTVHLSVSKYNTVDACQSTYSVDKPVGEMARALLSFMRPHSSPVELRRY